MRSFIIFLTLVSLSLTTFSQGFTGGLTAGLNASQVDGDKCEGYHKVGIHGGIYSKYYFDDQTAITFKLQYMPKGSYHNNPEKNYSFKIYLHYVELPINLSYQIYKNIDITGGLSAGWLIKAKVEDATGEVATNRLAYKKIDFNALGGINYHITDNIALGLQFSYSLLPINSYLRPQYNNMIIADISYEF